MGCSYVSTPSWLKDAEHWIRISDQPRTNTVGLLPVTFGPNPVLTFRDSVSAKDVTNSCRLECLLAPSHTLREELIGHY